MAILLLVLAPLVLVTSIVGGVLLVIRSQRAARKPECEACRYDMRGHGQDPPACPECGGSRIAAASSAVSHNKKTLSLGIALLIAGSVIGLPMLLFLLLLIAVSDLFW